MNLIGTGFHTLLFFPLLVWKVFFGAHDFLVFWYIQTVVLSIFIIKTMTWADELKSLHTIPLPIGIFGLVSTEIDTIEYSNNDYLLFLGLKFIITIVVSFTIVRVLISSASKSMLYDLLVVTLICALFRIDDVFFDNLMHYMYILWHLNTCPLMVAFFLFFYTVDKVTQKKTMLPFSIIRSFLFPWGLLVYMERVMSFLKLLRKT